jgi:cytidylate kinase
VAGVVTISASYGARGDKIAHLVAERLDLPFLDRAIPAGAAHLLNLPADVAESLDERTPGRWERIAAGFANAATPIGPGPVPTEAVAEPERFRQASVAKLSEVADTTGAVVLGRAAMAVLGDRPDVLCVRLDGPAEARLAQVVALGVDEETARQAQKVVDRARDAYSRVFFNVRQNDPRLYHVILDSTALSVETCVDVIVLAATDRFATASQ